MGANLSAGGAVVAGPRMRKVKEKLAAEEKQELEEKYGVFISLHALIVACNTARRYFDVLGSSVSVEDRRASAEDREYVLQKKAADILDKACFTLRCGIVTDGEETALDEDEYLLCRAVVEVVELRKEIDQSHRNWRYLAESELRSLMGKWDRFMTEVNSSFLSQKQAIYKNEVVVGRLQSFQDSLQQLFSTVDRLFSPSDVFALSLVILELEKFAARLAIHS